MRVPRRPCAHGPLWLTRAWVCVALVLCGCGRTAPSPVERAGLDTEYVSVEDRETSIVLSLGKDGTFSVREGLHDRDRERVMRPEPAPLATGTWVYTDGRLELAGDGWTARYEADSTRVEIPARADTLSSLRWVTSTEGSPFSACDLVSMSEFDEFLHPTEGGGSPAW
ncbi:hypothetical protein KAW64_13815 [bacterium]|nr:hypothetical protein [bacterium]